MQSQHLQNIMNIPNKPLVSLKVSKLALQATKWKKKKNSFWIDLLMNMGRTSGELLRSLKKHLSPLNINHYKEGKTALVLKKELFVWPMEFFRILLGKKGKGKIKWNPLLWNSLPRIWTCVDVARRQCTMHGQCKLFVESLIYSFSFLLKTFTHFLSQIFNRWWMFGCINCVGVGFCLKSPVLIITGSRLYEKAPWLSGRAEV